MADILIRGMQMPMNCMVCDFRNRGFNLNGDLFCNCRLTKENVPDYYNIRMENCPLVELPEHGDLIDRDVLGEAPTYYGSHCDLDEVEDWINSAPVVIPANKEESE